MTIAITSKGCNAISSHPRNNSAGFFYSLLEKINKKQKLLMIV